MKQDFSIYKGTLVNVRNLVGLLKKYYPRIDQIQVSIYGLVHMWVSIDEDFKIIMIQPCGMLMTGSIKTVKEFTSIYTDTQFLILDYVDISSDKT